MRARKARGEVVEEETGDEKQELEALLAHQRSELEYRSNFYL